VAEWLMAHAWKACLGLNLTRVRISLSPPKGARPCFRTQRSLKPIRSKRWRKIRFLPEKADRKKVTYKNTLLTFDVSSLDIQCGMDQALFLRGKTKSGQQFVGAVSANVVGCGAKDFGKLKRHELPFKWWKK
jgi:hypothetical protein